MHSSTAVGNQCKPFDGWLKCVLFIKQIDKSSDSLDDYSCELISKEKDFLYRKRVRCDIRSPLSEHVYPSPENPSIHSHLYW